MRGIYRKRFSSPDIKHVWDRDGETVDLVPSVGGYGYFATFSDGVSVTLFIDEVEDVVN